MTSGKDVVFLCSFSEGLDDLPRNRRGNRRAILSILSKSKRFSVFEATSSPTTAKTLDALFAEGFLLHVKGGEFPWSHVELSQKALAYLEGSEPCR